MDAWIQWNRDGFVAGVAGAVTTAFDQRFVRVHARGAWLVAVAEPLQRPNAHGSTGGEVGRKIFPPFGDCSGMSRGLSLDGGVGAQQDLLPPICQLLGATSGARGAMLGWAVGRGGLKMAEATGGGTTDRR